uniref:Large ribosomal subunit protein mL62 n=1 Tax=Saccoglossus kowalevskii TaxID=10224 RepID=A0ABM0MEK7_SACKO|nr:PREDICTED: peptidyl-tRNA hydrolase ICT1, mitochondrial-like [Saccoglossus kowalevskii]
MSENEHHNVADNYVVCDTFSETADITFFTPGGYKHKLTISYSRSSGPGGQNVNKVNSKVDVRFNVQSAEWIPQNLRNKILEKFKTKINAKGELIVTSDSTRAQIRNLRDCMQKIRDIIEEANKKPKPLSDKDRATIRMRAERYHRERLRLKKIHSVKKDDRHVYLD